MQGYAPGVVQRKVVQISKIVSRELCPVQILNSCQGINLPGADLALPSFCGDVQSRIGRGRCHHATRCTLILRHLLNVLVVPNRVLSLLNHLATLLDTMGVSGVFGVQVRPLPLHVCHRRFGPCWGRFGRRTRTTEPLRLGHHLLGASMTLQMWGFALGGFGRILHFLF